MIRRETRLRFVVGICCIVLICLVRAAAAQDAASKPVAPWATKTKFQDALSQPLSLSWTDRPLRPGLKELSDLRRVAILLDRRIDPMSLVSLQTPKVALKQLVEQAVAPLAVEVSVIGNVLYVGPRATARRLRTVVDLRHDELVLPSTAPKAELTSASSARLTRRLVQWDDLTTPVEILNGIAERYALKIEGLDTVPHDLWAGSVLLSVTSTEALQLVLGQFDLSFVWIERGKSVRIVPLPDAPRIERSYEVGTKADQLVRSLPKEVPEAAITIKATKLIISARSEEHEQIDALLHPNRPVVRKPNALPPQVFFTFEVKNAPLIEFMRTFEKQSDFRFEYDADELEQAGVKLTREVSLKMQKAKPAELFRAMFAESGVDFEIDGTTVMLSPK